MLLSGQSGVLYRILRLGSHRLHQPERLDHRLFVGQRHLLQRQSVKLRDVGLHVQLQPTEEIVIIPINGPCRLGQCLKTQRDHGFKLFFGDDPLP